MTDSFFQQLEQVKPMKTVIHYNRDWGEWVVKVWDDQGIRRPEQDAFESTRQDAVETSEAMHEHAASHGDAGSAALNGTWSAVSGSPTRVIGES